MLTPVDLETMVFRRGFRGYRASEVQDFMRKLSLDYESLYKENFKLKEKIESLEESISAYQEMESTLKKTLYLAQETANEIKISSEKQAEVILREAQNRAEEMKLRVREEIQTELQNLADLKQRVELFRIQFKNFLQTLIEMTDSRLDLDEIWERMMEISRREESSEEAAAYREEAAAYREEASTP